MGDHRTPGTQKTVVGDEETVKVGYDDGRSVGILANMDSGAGYASIDDDIAREMRMGLEAPPDTVTIKSSPGEEERPVFPVGLKIAGWTSWSTNAAVLWSWR